MQTTTDGKLSPAIHAEDTQPGLLHPWKKYHIYIDMKYVKYVAFPS